jgi:tungstate transport system substrate-binding protein
MTSSTLARGLVTMAAVLLIASGTAQSAQPLRLATTTSTENSGLLGYLLPAFEERSGVAVHVIAVGTGKALRIARAGDVDVVMVHARPAEERFVAAGHGATASTAARSCTTTSSWSARAEIRRRSRGPPVWRRR